MKFVIIAAGRGSRLGAKTLNKPKTIIPIHNGNSTIDVLLHNCHLVGINDIIIITGYKKSQIKNYLKDKWGTLNIQFVYNEEWKLENGVSVLKAKNKIKENETFMISMSDHLYFSNLLKTLKESNLADRIVNVGVDMRIDSIFDIDDGMKVVINPKNFLVKAMSKSLIKYNAIDVGLFKCKYSFFDYLETGYKNKVYSLSNSCNELIKNKMLGAIDIKDNFWLDIDTPEALEFGKKKIASLGPTM